MKRIKVLFIIFGIIIMIMFFIITKITRNISNTIKTEQQIVYLVGEDMVDLDKTNTIMIKVKSEECLGAIEGIIIPDSSIESIKIMPTEEEWSVTTNELTGKFNAYKANGSTDGEIIKIEYKLKEGVEESIITVSNIKVVTTNYETKVIGELVKKVHVK